MCHSRASRECSPCMVVFCPVVDNFATFLTPMSRACSDRSAGSTEPKSVPHGRVHATAFTPAIASELRLKSDSRKMHHGAQTHAQPDTCLGSASPSAEAHTNRLRSKQCAMCCVQCAFRPSYASSLMARYWDRRMTTSPLHLSHEGMRWRVVVWVR